jgi:hypothetical protein
VGLEQGPAIEKPASERRQTPSPRLRRSGAASLQGRITHIEYVVLIKIYYDKKVFVIMFLVKAWYWGLIFHKNNK